MSFQVKRYAVDREIKLLLALFDQTAENVACHR